MATRPCLPETAIECESAHTKKSHPVIGRPVCRMGSDSSRVVVARPTVPSGYQAESQKNGHVTIYDPILNIGIRCINQFNVGFYSLFNFLSRSADQMASPGRKGRKEINTANLVQVQITSKHFIMKTKSQNVPRARTNVHPYCGKYTEKAEAHQHMKHMPVDGVKTINNPQKTLDLKPQKPLQCPFKLLQQCTNRVHGWHVPINIY